MTLSAHVDYFSSPLLPYPPHSLRPLLLVLLLLRSLLGRVLLHALGNGLVVFGNVVKEPVQAFLDGLVHLFAVAKDGRARLLGEGTRRGVKTSAPVVSVSFHMSTKKAWLFIYIWVKLQTQTPP